MSKGFPKKQGGSPSTKQSAPNRITTQVGQPPQHRHAVSAVTSVFPAVAEALGLEKQSAVMAVSRLFITALPNDYQAQVTPLRLEDSPKHPNPTLVVAVPHGTLAAELQLLSTALCQHVNQYAPQTGITLHAIRVEVSRSR